jgi:hypothetical protein
LHLRNKANSHVGQKTSKNQITLPKAITRQLPQVDYFDVSVREGEVILKPVAVIVLGERLKAVRAKIKLLGLTEQTVGGAIHWARRGRR